MNGRQARARAARAARASAPQQEVRHKLQGVLKLGLNMLHNMLLCMRAGWRDLGTMLLPPPPAHPPAAPALPATAFYIDANNSIVNETLRAMNDVAVKPIRCVLRC